MTTPSAPPAAALSPRAVAARYGVDAGKVRAWIRSGQLRAINVAATVGGKSRWRITAEDLATFEAARAAASSPRPSRRRAKSGWTYKYF